MPTSSACPCGWDHAPAVNPYSFGSVEYWAWIHGQTAADQVHEEGWQTPENNRLEGSPYRSRLSVTIEAWQATGTRWAEANRHARGELADKDHSVSEAWEAGYIAGFPDPAQLPPDVE